MSIRSWLAEKLNPAQGNIAGKEVIASPTNILDFEQAYREIDIVHRSIELIINALQEVPWIVEGGGPIKRINKLVNDRPNPFEDRNKLFRRSFLDYMLDGNAFFYYDRYEGSLYILPANDVEIIPDEKTYIKRYDYLISSDSDMFSISRARKKEQSTISFFPEEIIHIKNDNEDSIYRGASHLLSLERIIELYYTLINFQRQFFKNNAIPGFVLSTENVLSDKVKDRLLERWRMNYTTIFDGARSPAILDGGLGIDKFSNISFNELDFEKSVERLQQDMAKALGVPFVLLKSGNNANVGTNQVLFYRHTILPILNQYTSAFAHFFGPDVKIRADEFSITAIQPDLKTKALYFSTLVNAGVITPNEARKGLNFIDLDDEECNHIRIPENIAGSAKDPSEGGRPPNTDANQGGSNNSGNSSSEAN